jgi:hypothetical protein
MDNDDHPIPETQPPFVQVSETVLEALNSGASGGRSEEKKARQGVRVLRGVGRYHSVCERAAIPWHHSRHFLRGGVCCANSPKMQLGKPSSGCSRSSRHWPLSFWRRAGRRTSPSFSASLPLSQGRLSCRLNSRGSGKREASGLKSDWPAATEP